MLCGSLIRGGAPAITIGFETSDSFYNIGAYNLNALAGIPNRVLFKSAQTRGGTRGDIHIHDLTLIGVATLSA
jgi:hypothetical protein